MGKIVLLDELTINQIAAGEVIERPASVVKEMLENSIDAGATKITVEIKNGGISYIRISDNGKGIAKDDVELAFERHATSKIRTAQDLQEIKSMGFRGEALASIAAIANVELISKTEEQQSGTKIVVEGGNVLSIEEVGCSTGTAITVRNLFFNTPVRYKFLKKDFTETGYIEDVITRVALIHPEVAIKLINTGKTTIQTNGDGDIKSVIYSFYGKEIAKEIISVDYEYEYIKIKGVIGKPAIARSNRSNQIFFVNDRYIKDKILSVSAEQGYKGLIPVGKFAFLILNLEMNPSKVDVNVHPAKLEVRFSEENVVFQAVYHAIKSTLLQSDLISDRDKNKEIKEASKDAFKMDYTNNNGGLFGKKTTINDDKEATIKIDTPNISKEVKNTKISQVQSTTTQENLENMDVLERLKRLQQQLKKDIAANPSIELTDSYKVMEQRYNEILTATDEIKEYKKEEDNEVKQNIEEEKTEIEEKQSEDVNQEAPITTEEKQDLEQKDKKEQKLEDYEDNDIEEEKLNLTDAIKQNLKIEKDDNNKLEDNIVSEKVEDVKEQILSFESMYRQIFGKEPYGGRKPVEDTSKKEESPYKITEDDLDDNVSVFENMEEYKKPSYKFIGIAFKTYIILEMNQELYIMDQHAAHERILYEKVKKNFFSETEKQSQMLLLPDIITLTNKEMSIAKDNFKLFERAGFMLEEFGDNTIKVSGVPEICLDLDTKELFMETLDEINTVARTAKKEKEERFIATVACKAAVKANMALTEEEVTSLMNELLKLPNPFSCPHGRPTVIKMSKYDIERKFVRK